MSTEPDYYKSFEHTRGAKTLLAHCQSNVRIASDGTVEGTIVEALGNNGEWVGLRGCVAVSLAAPKDGATRALVITIIDPISNIVGAFDLSVSDLKG